MIASRFFRTAQHDHADPAQRVQGIAALAPDADDLARLLASDPASDVRKAAAQRCTRLSALASAWRTEADPDVHAALEHALGRALAASDDASAVTAFLAADHCSDPIRAEVARQAQDGERGRFAIGGLRDEHLLVLMALEAPHAETRLAAAEKVHTRAGLEQLVDAARNKDRGVARLARQRLDAIASREGRAAEADSILTALEALAGQPGPILSAVVELNRRWDALDLKDDPERMARGVAARETLQARFDREHEEQRARARFASRLREWTTALHPPESPEGIGALRGELDGLRAEAGALGDADATVALDALAARLADWETEGRAQAAAQALVDEIEALAAGTGIDDAGVPERWQALDRAIRAPELTRRFETALIAIEQRRLAAIQAERQQANAVRQEVHSLLHAAEQALAGGELHAAREALDRIRERKGEAGQLPKPTAQRLGRLSQQLGELERWATFGQHQARLQLCERAEALTAQSLDATRIAAEVKKLRGEWKLLDQQHAGVPKSLWERFDGACERAYAPAARQFAEAASRRKEARRQREEFIAMAALHAPTLLVEPRDWRAIERWVRETEQRWREGDLGSVDPAAWKALDAEFKLALAPARDALAAVRNEAKTQRQALIAEVTALGEHATERDAPARVRTIQARWQEVAKAMPLPQRDERVLWEAFRAGCDAVFRVRDGKRKEEEGRKEEGRRALEEVCAKLEALAGSTDDEAALRRRVRELRDEWRKAPGSERAPPALDARFRKAAGAVEAAVTARGRSREAAKWSTLLAKERLCGDLDRLVVDGADAASAAAAIEALRGTWASLPALAGRWEPALEARRDAALRALEEPTARGEHRERIEKAAAARGELLIELEMLAGLESPADVYPQRLRLQVQKLKARFSGAASDAANDTGERLLAWCVQPGVVTAADRQRVEAVVAVLGGSR